ncbi:LacI family DNA-binding transcriptional regulator [Herbiconiux sp. SYSU D00978]|uniref:LacI family DNA-binding transcriptional regulator n=1 Tax=Herbiconiux sp. SYSU D00978 TaxID=2812562 RepID=UPI001A96E682|nr:LacI family DNA-binding transcriptional regulator [Herbiconiux sp. SYSU D00978]
MSSERPRPPASPTISEVAAAAGVGRATVARSLGNYGSVSEATRSHVLAVAARLGYRVNSLARSMTTGVTKTLGVVLADVANPFFAGVLRGLSDAAKQEGYDILVLSTNEELSEEKAAVGLLLDKQVDGLIVASAATRNDDLAHLQAVRERGVPIVLIDRLLAGFDADSVVINNREAAREAVATLIEAGHTRIGFVWGPVTVQPAEDLEAMRSVLDGALWSDGERLRGYLDALADADLEFDTSLVTHVIKTETQATRAVSGMLALAEPPTAFFTTETDATVGTLRALRNRRLRCPDDVSLLGFDDTPWADVMEPPLSMVAQPMRDVGARAAELLIARIHGGDDEPLVHEVLPAQMVERGSVRKRKPTLLPR